MTLHLLSILGLRTKITYLVAGGPNVKLNSTQAMYDITRYENISPLSMILEQLLKMRQKKCSAVEEVLTCIGTQRVDKKSAKVNGIQGDIG
ncbi:hypothetical protein AAES_121042 [Amazona aestiva]|uniref:Uncharacterized protein n=1 Tax=Amazona aestiva TaxID=12930 RepID=A0A0Q3TBY1_AMAAE|nr:hypothetical protein AAES_121042 [Amazona aestiva]